MITSYAQNPVPTFFDDDGKPLVGGLIKTFVAGTNNPVATYNSSGALNPTTIQLNSRGEYPQGICLDITREYKFKLYRADNSEVWTKDHVKAQGTATIEVKGIDTIIADVDGNTGVPSVDVSFNENIANIEFHNLKGEKGEKGEKGATGSEGKAGANGKTWLPSVSAAGDLSWTQSDSETAPTPRNIKGPKGDKGSDASVTAEAVNALTGLTISTSGNAATATKATGDSDGNNIKTTYATKSEVQSAIASVHSHTNKTELDKIADGDVAKWNGKYSKPSGGIPEGDLAQSVQTSLGKADTALQASAISDMETKTHASSTYQPKGDYLTTETDPTVPAWAKAESKPSYTASEVGAATASHTHKVKINGSEKTINPSSGSVVDLGTYLTSHQDISGKENSSNKVKAWSATTTDAHYPSEKLVKTALDGKSNTGHNHSGSDITSKVDAATTADKLGTLTEGYGNVVVQNGTSTLASDVFRTYSDEPNGNLLIVGRSDLARKSRVQLVQNGFTSHLGPTTITADRDWSLPNANGTLALTSDILPFSRYTSAKGSSFLVQVARFTATSANANFSAAINVVTGCMTSGGRVEKYTIFAEGRRGSSTSNFNAFCSVSALKLGWSNASYPNTEHLYYYNEYKDGKAILNIYVQLKSYCTIEVIEDGKLSENNGVTCEFPMSIISAIPEGTLEANRHGIAGNSIVHNSGDETIAGVKTFSSTIQGNAATATTATKWNGWNIVVDGAVTTAANTLFFV